MNLRQQKKRIMLTAVILALEVVLFAQRIKGQDVFNTMPPPTRTSFSCKGRDTGLYADVQTNCRLYHTCDNHGNQFSHFCPEDTAFRQDALVCDHAHLVDCKKSVGLIRQVKEDPTELEDKSNNFKSSSDLSRSYSIIPAQPSRFLETPKENQKKPTTFFMSSTVFLRDGSKPQPRADLIQSNRSGKNNFSSTLEPFPYRKNNNDYKQSTDKFKNSVKESIPNNQRLLQQNQNYPYQETLKSIQNRTEKFVIHPTTSRTNSAGTEFPIPSLTGALSGSENSEEDPYYPKHSTTTEVYTLTNKKKSQKPFSHSTKRPWLSDLDLKIPDRLPDLNGLEDLVDRRKLFFIPRNKNF